MPAYNFQKQFAPLVESGQKCQTIRKTNKGAKVGDTAYLYYGQRTKQCRKLGEGTITEIRSITILCTGLQQAIGAWVGNIWYEDRALNCLAQDDGFESGEAMVAWFADLYGLPFHGYLHKWTLNKP